MIHCEGFHNLNGLVPICQRIFKICRVQDLKFYVRTRACEKRESGNQPLFLNDKNATKIFIVSFERDSKTIHRSLLHNFYVCLIS